VRRYLLDGALVERAWVVAETLASVERFASGGVGVFLARLRDGGDLVGFTGFRLFEKLELLFGVLPQFTRRGLASEAARAAVGYAFERAGLALVRATVDSPNVASIHLLERLGMSRVGEGLRPRFELRREDWRI
jgi:RimJ/RimL family protein N-acetyltransferase